MDMGIPFWSWLGHHRCEQCSALFAHDFRLGHNLRVIIAQVIRYVPVQLVFVIGAPNGSVRANAPASGE